MNLTAPCKECESRVSLCHDSCEKYKQFKSDKEQVKVNRAEYMKERSFIVESVARTKK